MLHIALCEDDARQREESSALLEAYFTARDLAARVRVFSSGAQLLGALSDGLFDIYLLDIIMPGMNGIALGREIRKRDRNSSILYLTSSPDFALESYQTKASSYLLKPVKKDELFAALDDAAAIHTHRKQNGILVKCHGGTIYLTADDIYFAELHNRAVSYRLREGTLESMTISGSFRDAVSPLLQSKNFILCGSSFIVNLHYVRLVDKNGAQFTDGHYLVLPKSACAPLRNAWSDYWLEGDTLP